MWTPVDLIRQLYNLIMWRAVKKKKMQALMRTHIKDMVKKGKMHELGGRLRLRQQMGKMKHVRKTSVQDEQNPERGLKKI